MSVLATTPGSAPAAPPQTPGSWRARFRQRLLRTAPTDLEPVVLHHSRIYILPTRRGAAFIATIMTMLVLSLNYALSLGFAITFLLSGLAAAALLHTWRNLAGLELRPLAAGDTFAGNALPFTVALGGGGSPRTAIALAAGDGATMMADVAADATVPVTVELPTARRGRFPLGRVTLSTVYPLGLWRGWAYIHFPLAGIVYPAPEADAPALPPGSVGHDANAAARGDDADLAGLRTYQTGDPVQRIAWKAVARGGGWYTKQFEGAGGGGPVDLAWHALPRGVEVETRLARLAAWVLAAERAARPFALSVPGFALPAGQGRDHRRAALTALALCPDDVQ
jgi:uncharacterized protein (DUF58 family)